MQKKNLASPFVFIYRKTPPNCGEKITNTNPTEPSTTNHHCGSALLFFSMLYKHLAKSAITQAKYLSRFKSTISTKMPFTVGQQFPTGVEFTHIPIQFNDLSLINPLKCDTTAKLNVDNLLQQLSTSDKPLLVVVSVPGAFTPTCTERHIPGYLSNLSKLTDKKVGAIIVLACNDAFVVNAWGKTLVKAYVKDVENLPQIYFASDGGFSGQFELAADRGGVFRNKRYATLVDSRDKTVKYFGVETESGVHVSGVENILDAKL